MTEQRWKLEMSAVITGREIKDSTLDLIRFHTEELGHYISRAGSDEHPNESVVLTLRAESWPERPPPDLAVVREALKEWVDFYDEATADPFDSVSNIVRAAHGERTERTRNALRILGEEK